MGSGKARTGLGLGLWMSRRKPAVGFPGLRLSRAGVGPIKMVVPAVPLGGRCSWTLFPEVVLVTGCVRSASVPGTWGVWVGRAEAPMMHVPDIRTGVTYGGASLFPFPSRGRPLGISRHIRGSGVLAAGGVPATPQAEGPRRDSPSHPLCSGSWCSRGSLCSGRVQPETSPRNQTRMAGFGEEEGRGSFCIGGRTGTRARLCPCLSYAQRGPAHEQV